MTADSYAELFFNDLDGFDIDFRMPNCVMNLLGAFGGELAHGNFFHHAACLARLPLRTLQSARSDSIQFLEVAFRQAFGLDGGVRFVETSLSAYGAFAMSGWSWRGVL